MIISRVSVQFTFPCDEGPSLETLDFVFNILATHQPFIFPKKKKMTYDMDKKNKVKNKTRK